MTVWTNLFSLLLAIFVVAFNLIVLLATAIQPRLHTISNILSCNLWIANCFTGIVGIFHNLFYSTVIQTDVIQLINPSSTLSDKNLSQEKTISATNSENYIHALGPQTLAALFNSTVSLLTLLAMAFVQIFAKYQNWMPKSAPARISACLWTVVVVIIFVNFTLVQITKSLSLIVAFQLALLTIFLVINLMIHPINLFIASKSNQNAYLLKAITQSLWLLLHSLSFTLLAMMLVWESSQTTTTPIQEAENAELVSLQLSAYSVHCIANPIIAILRDQRLLNAIGSLVNAKENRRDTDYALILQNETTNQWFSPDQWIFRHLPPPPPYMSPANSTQEINQQIDCIESTDSSSDDERHNPRPVIIMIRESSNN
uniref:Uncharacterized protein n=1 Tax=Panagrolaimus sp. JU765 TaxID=591449 RepID=A0AC34Q1J7_9BILA